MKVFLILAAAASLASAASGTSGFVGNYGTVLSYPTGLQVLPEMSGPEDAVETVNFVPPGAGEPGPAAARAGWFQVLIMPARIVAKYNKIDDLDGYVNAIIAESNANGEKPTSVRYKKSSLPGRMVSLAAPRGPFDTMVFLRGKTLYYRFAYVRGNAAAERMTASRLEGVAPKTKAKSKRASK